MSIEVAPATIAEIDASIRAFREAAACQIVHDSILLRGMADPYRIRIDGVEAGHAGVWNCHDPGRIMEFHLEPGFQDRAEAAFQVLIGVSRAMEAEAQTNLPLMFGLLQSQCRSTWTSKMLFGNPVETDLPNPGGTFRTALPEEAQFGGSPRSAEFVIEVDGRAIAWGGYLGHYNPPYVDVHMEVAPEFRQQGYGSYFVQEVKRRCLEAGKIPAARSDPVNEASHRTLARAGLPKIGELLVGKIQKR